MFDHYRTGVASASTFVCPLYWCQLCGIRKYEVRVTMPSYVTMVQLVEKLKGARAHMHTHTRTR